MLNNIEKFLLFFCEPIDLVVDADLTIFELKPVIKEKLSRDISKQVRITFSTPDDFSDIDFAVRLNDDIIATAQIKGGEPVTIGQIKDVLYDLYEFIEMVNSDLD